MENVIGKQELIDIISEKSGVSKKDTTDVLNLYFETVKESLKEGSKVRVKGFGTFETRERAARQGRNPRNPEEVIEIPATKAVGFKPGKDFKEAIQ